MGRLSRKYSGDGSLVGLVVADGSTAGTCVACDASTEPLGICVGQQPDGLCTIATQGETAFALAGAAIATDASNFLTTDSDGAVVSFNPATTETAAYQIGFCVRPDGGAVADGELVEVAINIAYAAAVAGGGD